MDTKLYLEFQTQAGDSLRVSLDQPKASLTREEIEEQMGNIVAADVFKVKGQPLTAIKSAYKVEISKTNFIGE